MEQDGSGYLAVSAALTVIKVKLDLNRSNVSMQPVQPLTRELKLLLLVHVDESALAPALIWQGMYDSTCLTDGIQESSANPLAVQP